MKFYIKISTGLPNEKRILETLVDGHNEEQAKSRALKQFEYSAWFWADGKTISFKEYNAHSCTELKAKGASVKFFAAETVEIRAATKSEIAKSSPRAFAQHFNALNENF